MGPIDKTENKETMTKIYKQGPSFQSIDKIDFLPAKEYKLDNQVPVSVIEAGSQDVTKVDLEFPAGAVQAGIPLLASTTAKLMQEGTARKSSMEISEMIDYYGAYLSSQTYHHHTVVTILCLSRHLKPMLNHTKENINTPSFPEHQYDHFLQKKHE